MDKSSSDVLRHTMETSYAILERRRVAAQNHGEVHGRSSNTFPIRSRSLTETWPWQGTSSVTRFRSLSVAEDEVAFQSCGADGDAEDTAPGSSLALADEDDDTEEVYALLEQADENLRYGALWAARLGLQQAMQRLGLESY